MKTTTKEMPAMPKIETMTDCINQIEMSDYECVGGYLKNNKGFIKIKELIKKQSDFILELQLNSVAHTEYMRDNLLDATKADEIKYVSAKKEVLTDVIEKLKDLT